MCLYQQKCICDINVASHHHKETDVKTSGIQLKPEQDHINMRSIGSKFQHAILCLQFL